jgi:hypothetical protein
LEAISAAGVYSQALTPLRRAALKAQFILSDAEGGVEGRATSPRRGGFIKAALHLA